MSPIEARRQKQENDFIRHELLAGRASQIPNGDYRVVLPSGVYFIGKEYAERMLAQRVAANS
jgi:hypothetical protein